MKISIQLYQRIGVQTYFGLQIPASGHFMGAVDKPIWKRFIYDLYDLCFLISSDCYRKRNKQGIFIAIC